MPIPVFNAIIATGITHREVLEGNNSADSILNLTIRSNTIYRISKYTQVHINIPIGDYNAYLYIDLPDIEGAHITLPDGLDKAGDPIEEASRGERWELSIDSDLGILTLNTGRISYE